MRKVFCIVAVSLGGLILFTHAKLGLFIYNKAESKQPKVEAAIPSHDLSVNHIDWFQNAFQLAGSGLIIGLKENSPDSTDIDIIGKLLRSPISADNFDTHATGMATILTGRGTNAKTSLGVAPDAQLLLSSFTNVFPDDQAYLQDLTVQNHSYGFEIDNVYDELAQAYDQSIFESNHTLHVFSAGNLGRLIPDHGAYAGVEGFANLSGGIKQAKNTMVIGSTDLYNTVQAQSSKGPTFDGRIKPDIVAYGSQGTSESAALVSGSATLLAEQYRSIKGSLPSADLLKSIMIASANEIGTKGPDFQSGFGSLNMVQASRLVMNQQTIQDTLPLMTSHTHSIVVPANTLELRVSLVWNDIEADINTDKALLNDLDLVGGQNGITYLPLVPDSRVDFLSQAATHKRDSLNNTELLIIDRPAEGSLEITVNAFSLNEEQPYSIAYSFKKSNEFNWLSPNANSEFVTEETLIYRYKNGYSASPEISLSRDRGAWENVSSNEYVFTEPGNYVFRALVNGDEFYTDTLRVTEQPVINKLFECDDELLFTWDRNGADEFEVEGIDPQDYELTTILTTSDTSVFLNASDPLLSLGYLKIKPIKDGNALPKSVLYEYSVDGIGCLYKNWTASVNADQVDLSLELTTDWNVERVSFLKVFGGDTVQLESIGNENIFSAESTEERNGYYQYIAQIDLINAIGSKAEVFTDVIEIPVFVAEEYVVFPNPVKEGEDIFFLGGDDISRLRFFDLQGNFVTSVFINSNVDSFSLIGLAPGVYMYQLVDLDSKLVDTGRIIIE